MAITTGAVAGGGSRGILAARRKVWMKDKLAELEPNINPLLIALRKLSNVSIGQPKDEWREHEDFPIRTATSGSETSGSTTIDVTSGQGSYAGVGQLVINVRTAEVFKVTAIATDAWTVTRSIGDTAAAAMNSGDVLMILGTSFAENSAAPDPRANAETAAYNYTQIGRSDFGASGTLIAMDNYGADALPKLAKERARDHNKEIERTLWWGERSETTSGNYAVRTCGGINEFQTQSYSFGGAFSMQLLYDALEVGMRYGSETKTLYCPLSVASNISLEAMDKIRTVTGASSFGVNVKRLESPHGMVNIVVHKMFEGGQFAKDAHLLDLSNFSYTHLKGRDTSLYEGLETNGTDGEVHGFMSEYSLRRQLAKTHQKWTDVSNG